LAIIGKPKLYRPRLGRIDLEPGFGKLVAKADAAMTVSLWPGCLAIIMPAMLRNEMEFALTEAARRP
jgi:hypothetical protein